VTVRTEKSVAIVQSCYVPWKGYFDLINSVDEFILFDDRQFTRRDWRNRNRIKTGQGVRWLSIPVKVKGRYHQRIDDVEVSDASWADRHWQTIRHAYGRAPHFDRYREALEGLYSSCAGVARLSEINDVFLRAICAFLDVRTPLTSAAKDYEAEGSKTDRILSICIAAEATTYVSGPTAREYLDEDLLNEAGIGVRYMDYAGYPEYEQLYPPFEHAVSVVDVLVHTGPDAPKYLKTFRSSLHGRDAA
jgi:hypothetical protein